MSKASVVEEISAKNVRANVEKIVRDIPHRAAGSDNGRRMAEYSRDAMLKAGLTDVKIYELPAIVSFPEHAEFRVESPAAVAIQANTLGHSLETMPEGLSGELVYVGSGTQADYEGKDVRGKIVLTELSYSPARHEKQRIAGQKGAIGAVMMNWGLPDNEAVPFGSVKPVWGNPTPDNFKTEMATLPCIGIARVAGLRLKAQCEKAEVSNPVRVWMRTHVVNGWRPVQITVAELPAKASPETGDFVMVGGHQDSWPGEAATDNAAGNSCMIELARVFKKHEDKLRRGLLFGFWTAHETGTMAGSAWFADHAWDKLRDHACAYMQIDQPSCLGTTIWHTTSNAELKEFHQREEKALMPEREISWKRVTKSGDASFIGIGIPMFQGEGAFTEAELKATALATRGWWHHSIECNIDKLDWDYMQPHMRVYAAYLWELCTAPVLPFTYVPVAEQVIKRLQELAPVGASVGIEGVLACAQAFATSAQKLDAAAARARAAFEAGKGNEDTARLINRAMKRISRLLVPLMSSAIGKYGHDPYGYTPQNTVIPALYDVARVSKLEQGEERWMLETKSVRDRNRVSDALADAIAIVEDTLARVG